ncbi:MAG: MgtC/SapB family protein [Clostridia bacterium]|nr:MgtC/SapB family protein [Clostridia bacterium]
MFDGIIAQTPWVVRILVACLCGGAIGVERTMRQKDAGFRTHCIVAMGAALAVIVSKYGFFDILIDYPELKIQADASRIASNILTGVGFLGAGMIFVKGPNIRGLTTAAGIWATAAVGMAIGSGLYFVGLASTVLVIVLQIVFHAFLIGFDKILANDVRNDIVVSLRNTPEAVSAFKAQLEDNGMQVLNSRLSLQSRAEKITLTLTVHSDKDIDFLQIASIVQTNPDVYSLTVD